MTRVRASQIFTHAVEDAVAAKKMLDDGKPFTEVVSQFSTCPSKENGGDLGWMPEENAQALMGEVGEMDQGKILGPIHSPYGYHILQITEIEKEEALITFNPDTPMTEVNRVLPEVHTLLFKHFHIGMPVSGYKPEETIFTVCEQHGKTVGEVLGLLNKEAGQDNGRFITAEQLKEKMKAGEPIALLDIREQWERDIACIEEATFITRENSESVLAGLAPDQEIVVIDWKGDRTASFQKYLGQRGFTNVQGIEGGIDAWAEKVDTRMARYEIDEEDDDYRYEDIFDDVQ
ncbi:peptidylprolyl isomerase [Nitrospina watsonii]|uniref:Parvulin-like peptidyl-prolyl isomerase n=1 Tax=Nitrospina watsonii TaxID=1323948 RepID=A0ABM9HES0_9BACT|nr:peptidylprolyl isomerase [Nitrospina watsonii]CAI2718634.1 Parvulin-like peptidyl-prolyl isomerase [Nitrospina watsonii]